MKILIAGVLPLLLASTPQAAGSNSCLSSFLGLSKPDPVPAPVKEYENEIYSSCFKKRIKTLDSSHHSNQLLNASEAQRELLEVQKQRPPFPSLLAFARTDLASILLPAYKMLGQDCSAEDYEKDFTSYHRNMFLMKDPPKGHAVIFYRPLLLTSELAPHVLRLLYHRLCDAMWGDLERALDSSKDSIRDKKILFVGLGDAGLAATYHAIAIIRKHRIISEAGGRRNENNQVGVITIASPHPISKEALLRYHFGRENFFAFANAERLVSDSPDYTATGYFESIADQLFVVPETIQYYETYIMNIYTQQYLNIDVQRVLPDGYCDMTRDTGDHVKRHFMTKAEEIGRTITGVLRSFDFFIKNSLLEDYNACASSLRNRIQKALDERWEASEAFCTKYGAQNWALQERVECLYKVDNGKIRCQYSDGNATRVFVEYDVSFPERSDRVPLPLTPPTPSQEDELMVSQLVDAAFFDEVPLTTERKELWETLQDLDSCTKSLFDAQPGLQLFSPYHPEVSTMELRFSTWLFEGKTCKVQVTPDDTSLHLMHQTAPESRLALLSSPALLNTAECQGIFPPAIKKDIEHTVPYWRNLRNYAASPQNTGLYEVKDVIVHNQLQKRHGDRIVRELLALINEHIGGSPALEQYSCNVPQTLWHGEKLCPVICHALAPYSSICERVYISTTGLKLSLRKGAAWYNPINDPTFTEVGMMKELPLLRRDRSTIIVKLGKGEEIFYLTAFLEGRLHESYHLRLKGSPLDRSA